MARTPASTSPELALHWRLAAVSVDRAKAADYACRAGQRALDLLAPREAVKLFGDAVELTATVDSSERCRGADRARRGTAPDRRRHLPRDATGGLADRLRPRRSRARRTSGPREQPRLRKRGRGDRRAAPSRDQASDRTRRSAAASTPGAPTRAPGDGAGVPPRLPVSLGARRRSARVGPRDAATRGRSPWPCAKRSTPTGLPRRSSSVAHLPPSLPSAQPRLQDPALRWWAHVIELHARVEQGEFDRAQVALERVQQIAEELGQPTLSGSRHFRPQPGSCFTAIWWPQSARPSAPSRSDRRRRARRDPDLRLALSLLSEPGPRPGDHRGARAEGERLTGPRRFAALASRGPCAGSTVEREAARCSGDATSDRFEHMLHGSARAHRAGAVRRRSRADGPDDAAPDPPRPHRAVR